MSNNPNETIPRHAEKAAEAEASLTRALDALRTWVVATVTWVPQTEIARYRLAASIIDRFDQVVTTEDCRWSAKEEDTALGDAIHDALLEGEPNYLLDAIDNCFARSFRELDEAQGMSAAAYHSDDIRAMRAEAV